MVPSYVTCESVHQYQIRHHQDVLYFTKTRCAVLSSFVMMVKNIASDHFSIIIKNTFKYLNTVPLTLIHCYKTKFIHFDVFRIKHLFILRINILDLTLLTKLKKNLSEQIFFFIVKGLN